MSIEFENKMPSLIDLMIEGARNGLSDGADVIVAEGYASAPVMTGTLRNSIHKEIKGNGNRVIVEASVPPGANPVSHNPFDYAHWRHEESSSPLYLSRPLKERQGTLMECVKEGMRNSLFRL